MRHRSAAASALVLLAGLACKSAAPSARTVQPTAPPPEFISGYVGQSLILRHVGTQQRVSLTRQELARAVGDCDVGVTVREATYSGGTATFKLEGLGPAVLPEKPATRGRGPCGTVAGFLVSVSGLGSGDEPETIRAELDQLLTTPDAYLGANGIAFDRPAGPQPKLAASQERNATFEERTLARQVRSWPRPILRVDPCYRDPSGRVRHEGEVEFAAVVGEDGRLHSPKLRTPLGSAHEEHVLRALSLWRYEPATADAPVAARINGRGTFRVY